MRSSELQRRYLAAYPDVLINLVAVYKWLGGGWLPENVEDLISEEARLRMASRTNWGELPEKSPQSQ